ncbi:hypothetical protein QUW13_03240 [Enterococcus hirae]|jgi:4-amino-4-deoxy-L-arabinose transferase-like glycosyltransferase|nr:hypothetical protein [Enterococcaceae bacterium]MCI1919041.1 hypothetical protein [Enterococcaceae bacterium]MDM8212891.1 hypothetical protein [Enterococcus hirae]
MATSRAANRKQLEENSQKKKFNLLVILIMLAIINVCIFLMNAGVFPPLISLDALPFNPLYINILLNLVFGLYGIYSIFRQRNLIMSWLLIIITLLPPVVILFFLGSLVL